MISHFNKGESHPCIWHVMLTKNSSLYSVLLRGIKHGSIMKYPQQKKASITCKHPLLLPAKKFKATPSVTTTLSNVLRDYKGVNVVYSLDHDDNVIAEGYHCTLERLGDIICPKRLGLLCQGIFILHDTAIWTCDRWEKWTTLPTGLISYLVISISLDPLMKHQAGNRYQHEASCRLLPKDTWQWFLYARIQTLVPWWVKCLNADGQYMEAECVSSAKDAP